MGMQLQARHGILVLLITGVWWPAWSWAQSPTSEAPSGYQWEFDPSSHLALRGSQSPLWQLNFAKAEEKSYFDPLCSAAGAPLSWFRPADHHWHRGLWFSWKYIGGVNYWAEKPATHLSEGRTELVDLKVLRQDRDGATVVMNIHYHPTDQPSVLKEQRTLTMSAVDSAGNYRIDWRHIFTAGAKKTVIGPPENESDEENWPRYGGLSFRIDTRAMRDLSYLDNEGRKDLAINHQRALWVDASALVGPEFKQAAGVTIFDHPANFPDRPAKWHIIKKIKEKKSRDIFAFVNPAPMYGGAISLEPGQSFELLYRVLVHSGRPDATQLDKEAASFARSAAVK